MSIKEKLAAAKAGKKELTPKQQKVRTILNWVATAVCIVIIVFALVVAIFTISSTTNDRHLMQFGDTIYMNVASDSMKPTFTANDVIITQAFNKDTDISKIKVGQVITFETTASSSGGAVYRIYNTHRIVKINYTDETNTVVRTVVTRGDNQDGTWKEAAEELAKENPSRDVYGRTETVSVDAIVATWGDGETSGKMLKGCGAFSNWIQDTEHFGDSQKVRFFCVVVLPLILLFVIYAFVLIRTLVIAKIENQRKIASEQVVTVDSLSDEEKRRLAQEYLASLQQSGGEADVKADETVSDEPQVVQEGAQDVVVEDENTDTTQDNQ